MSKTPLTTSNSLASDIQKDLLIRGIIESDVLVPNTANFDIESVMNDFALSASKIVFGSHEQLRLLLLDKDSKDAYCSQLEIKSELFASLGMFGKFQILAALTTICKERVQHEQSKRKPTLNSTSLVSAYASPQAKPTQGVAALTSASKRRPVGSSNSSSKCAKSTHSTESAVVLVVGVVKECSEQEFMQQQSHNTQTISSVGVEMLPPQGEVKNIGTLGGDVFFLATKCGNDVSLGDKFFSNIICSAWNVLHTTELPTNCPFRTGIEGGDKASKEEEEVDPVLNYKIYELASEKKISKTSTTDSSVLQHNSLNYNSISKVKKADGKLDTCTSSVAMTLITMMRVRKWSRIW